MENVSFEYVKDETVLKMFPSASRPGKPWRWSDPPDSGKTSMINLIIRFYDPTSGGVLVNGIDIKKIDLCV